MTYESIGFNINVLCHKYGLRCRLMCRSIADRVSGSPPIHLRIFYTRQQDIESCMEGITTGSRPPERLDPVLVPAEMVLKRPKLYSTVTTDYSHVIYSDADVWYPPDFWLVYGQALTRYIPSYSSSWAKNISKDKADVIARSGRLNLTATELDSLSSPGMHHPVSWGRNGIFQCAPVSAAKYPDVDFIGVDKYDNVFAREARSKACAPELNKDSRVPGSMIYHLDHTRNWHGVDCEL